LVQEAGVVRGGSGGQDEEMKEEEQKVRGDEP
jgi:hypothetical protein